MLYADYTPFFFFFMLTPLKLATHYALRFEHYARAAADAAYFEPCCRFYRDAKMLFSLFIDCRHFHTATYVRFIFLALMPLYLIFIYGFIYLFFLR